MNRTPPIHLALVGLLCATTAGCDADDTPTQQDYDDVATAMSSALVTEDQGDVASMDDVLLIAEGDTPSGMDQDDGTYVGGTASFEYRYRVECTDASGTALQVCDETTDEAAVDVEWSGTLSTTRYDTRVERTGSWSLSNIQSDLVTFAGTSSFELASSFTALSRDVRRTYELSYAASYDELVYDRTSAALTGTVRYDVDAQRMADRGDSNVDASFSMDATLTFHGDHTATLVLDGEYSYRIDIDTGELTVISG